jgi:ABC-type polar amino acid transport system ATPase subunit
VVGFLVSHEMDFARRVAGQAALLAGVLKQAYEKMTS